MRVESEYIELSRDARRLLHTKWELKVDLVETLSELDSEDPR